MYHTTLTLPFLYVSIAFLSTWLLFLTKTKASCFLTRCPGCIVLSEHKLCDTPFDPYSIFTAHCQSPSPSTSAQFNVLSLLHCLAGTRSSWSWAHWSQWGFFYKFQCTLMWPEGGRGPMEEQSKILKAGVVAWHAAMGHSLNMEWLFSQVHCSLFTCHLIWKAKCSSLSKIYLWEIAWSLYALPWVACKEKDLLKTWSFYVSTFIHTYRIKVENLVQQKTLYVCIMMQRNKSRVSWNSWKTNPWCSLNPNLSFPIYHKNTRLLLCF